MISCSAPNQYLLEYPTHTHEINASRNQLWTEFHKFITACFSSSHPENVVPIISELKKMHDRFGNGQEDAGEGFHLLLDHIKDTGYSDHFMHRYTHDIYCANCKKIVSTQNDTAYHVEIPREYTKQQCKWADDDIVEYSGDLNNYIRHHITILDGFKCPQCKQTQPMVRLSHMVLVPNVLVIIFNKFSGKFVSPVPAELKFPGTDGKVIKYGIVSKIEHSGNMGGGHYVAHVKRGNDCTLMNDSTVGRGNFDTSSATYICFYHVL